MKHIFFLLMCNYVILCTRVFSLKDENSETKFNFRKTVSKSKIEKLENDAKKCQAYIKYIINNKITDEINYVDNKLTEIFGKANCIYIDTHLNAIKEYSCKKLLNKSNKIIQKLEEDPNFIAINSKYKDLQGQLSIYDSIKDVLDPSILILNEKTEILMKNYFKNHSNTLYLKFLEFYLLKEPFTKENYSFEEIKELMTKCSDKIEENCNRISNNEHFKLILKSFFEQTLPKTNPDASNIFKQLIDKGCVIKHHFYPMYLMEKTIESTVELIKFELEQELICFDDIMKDFEYNLDTIQSENKIQNEYNENKQKCANQKNPLSDPNSYEHLLILNIKNSILAESKKFFFEINYQVFFNDLDKKKVPDCFEDVFNEFYDQFRKRMTNVSGRGDIFTELVNKLSKYFTPDTILKRESFIYILNILKVDALISSEVLYLHYEIITKSLEPKISNKEMLDTLNLDLKNFLFRSSCKFDVYKSGLIKTQESKSETCKSVFIKKEDFFTENEIFYLLIEYAKTRSNLKKQFIDEIIKEDNIQRVLNVFKIFSYEHLLNLCFYNDNQKNMKPYQLMAYISNKQESKDYKADDTYSKNKTKFYEETIEFLINGKFSNEYEKQVNDKFDSKYFKNDSIIKTIENEIQKVINQFTNLYKRDHQIESKEERLNFFYQNLQNYFYLCLFLNKNTKNSKKELIRHIENDKTYQKHIKYLLNNAKKVNKK